jgi:[acyl-carrier-protein] S-malonyltransferase
MKIAWIFPGQGAQYVGMGKDFFDSYQVAKETFLEADDRLGFSLSKIIFEGPEDLLTQTKHSQLGIFVTSMAILRVIQKECPDLNPSVTAGLSLGEYTALCASNRLGFEETLLLVQERARLMNEACEKTPGTMAAVLGLDAAGIEEAVKGLDGVWVANFNAPGQTVVSGTKEGIEKASSILKEKGAKRVIPLTVHGAFHSGLMLSAQEGLTPWIEKAHFSTSSIDFVMNVPGNFIRTEEEIRTHLKAQVTQSVRWEQSIQAMKNAGVELFLEIGCGKTLSGLNRKMGISGISAVEKVSDLESVYAIA